MKKFWPSFKSIPLYSRFYSIYKAAQLIKCCKVHLELEGFEKIKQIKGTMNKREVKIGSSFAIMLKGNKRSYSTVRILNIRITKIFFRSD